MAEKPSVIRDTDDEARTLARSLIRDARYVSLAVLDAETGFPQVSRVLLAMDSDGVPFILVSRLSAHTKALASNQRCAFLAGEPKKGDPLAHARISVQCLAERIDQGSEHHQALRTRFLRLHPKAKLYIDFADFGFFRLVPEGASLNGGFGRAYNLPGIDLLEQAPITPEIE